MKGTSLYKYRKGTVAYMAPEVNNLLPGESFDAFKADMYSLGVCLHVMLFAEFPTNLNSSTNHSTEEVQGKKNASSDLEELRQRLWEG